MSFVCAQRPFGQRVANIGTWQNALAVLGFAAVIVNCALIGLSGQVSRLWPGLTSTQTIILIVTLEHIMLGLRTALTWLLPELPSWLAAEIARAEHCRREMQCKGLSPHMTPSPPSTTTSMQSQDNGFDVITPDVGAGVSPELCGAAAATTTTSFAGRSQVLTDNIVFHHIAPITPKFKKYNDGGGGGGGVADQHCDSSPCSQVRIDVLHPSRSGYAFFFLLKIF